MDFESITSWESLLNLLILPLLFGILRQAPKLKKIFDKIEANDKTLQLLESESALNRAALIEGSRYRLNKTLEHLENTGVPKKSDLDTLQGCAETYFNLGGNGALQYRYEEYMKTVGDYKNG